MSYKVLNVYEEKMTRKEPAEGFLFISELPRSCHVWEWFRRRWLSTPLMTRTTKLARAWPKPRRRRAAEAPLSSRTEDATRVRTARSAHVATVCARLHNKLAVAWRHSCADIQKSTVGHVASVAMATCVESSDSEMACFVLRFPSSFFVHFNICDVQHSCRWAFFFAH